MSAISARDEEAIRTAFAGLERDVRLRLELGPATVPVTLLSAGGREVDSLGDTQWLVEAVCALSERLTLDLVEHNRPGPWPQLTVGDGLVYRGMPLGHELAALVYAIVECGRAEPSLSAESRAQLDTLVGATEIRVYVTPT